MRVEKPADAAPPSTLETVAKVVNDVAKIADAVGKFFHKGDSKPATKPAQPLPSGFTGQAESLPDTAFGDGGFAPDGLPAIPTWDMSQLLGFDPNTLLPGFDPNTLLPGFDPNTLLAGFDPSTLLAGFDPNILGDGTDPFAG